MVGLYGAGDTAYGKLDPPSPNDQRRIHGTGESNHGRPSGVRAKSEGRVAHNAYSIAAYASVQKPLNTGGGSGESIMRWVKRMPIIFSAGSM